MKKNVTIMLFVLLGVASLPAQKISREKADAIVLESMSTETMLYTIFA